MPPEPLMRASRQPRSARSRASTSPIAGVRAQAGASRSLRRRRSNAASAAAFGGLSRRGAAVENGPRRAAKTGPVGTATPGLTNSTAHPGRCGGGRSTSPTPATWAGRDSRQTGTSAPRARAVRRSRPRRAGSSFQSAASPRRTPAASAEPPPRPAASGMRLCSAMRTPGGRPNAAASAVAARRARLLSPASSAAAKGPVTVRVSVGAGAISRVSERAAKATRLSSS